MFDAVIATLPAGDIARAKAFYREKLNLEPLQDEADGSALYRVGKTMLPIYPSEFSGTTKRRRPGSLYRISRRLWPISGVAAWSSR